MSYSGPFGDGDSTSVQLGFFGDVLRTSTIPIIAIRFHSGLAERGTYGIFGLNERLTIKTFLSYVPVFTFFGILATTASSLK